MNIRILIADDHQLFIDGLKSILRQEIGIQVIGEAGNGLELLKLLARTEPDVILTDIRMPVMDGITACKEIKNKFPNLPILALSMYDQPSDIVEMLEAGANGYLIKNADKDQMIRAIYAIYKHKKFFSPELTQLIDSYRSTQKKGPPKLTRREREILDLIAKGRTSMQISQELHISKLTVDTHRKNMLKKLGISTTTGLIKYALQLNNQ